MPFRTENARGSANYIRRYVCRGVGARHSCVSLGVRDPFSGHRTPIWLRFNPKTALFPVIYSSLMSSHLRPRLVESGGRLWIPLDVRLDAADGEELLASLEEQAKEVINLAYQP